MEQYLDFLRSRTFRQTILCHAGLTVDRTIQPDQLRKFHIAARAVPEAPEPDIRSRSVEKFKGLDGASLSIDHPLSKSAMMVLARSWPQTIAMAELPAQAAALLSGPAAPPAEVTEEDWQVLASNLLKAFVYSDDLVEVHIYPPQFTLQVSERPVASPWARYQARDELKVTNLRHERVEIDPLNQYLLPFLDGTRNCEDLVDLLLAGPVAGGKLVVEQNDQPVTDPIEAREILGTELRANLDWLARAALLVA
jgi:methyltransferase-like protein